MGNQRPKILCIVADTQHRNYLQSILIEKDFDFFGFATGTVAVIAADIVLPHVILVDLDLPLSVGLGIVRKLRRSQHFARTPIIAMTQNEHFVYNSVLVENMVTCLLLKPVNAEKLFPVLEAYL